MSRGKGKDCGKFPFEEDFPEEKFILMKNVMAVGGFCRFIPLFNLILKI